MASDMLEAPRSRKEKVTTTLPFWGQEIKWGVNFIWEKLMEFFLFNKFVQNFIFFPITDQESWLYNSNIGQILKANLWLIYCKRFESMVYTFLLHFEKSNFSDFWDPLKLFLEMQTSAFLRPLPPHVCKCLQLDTPSPPKKCGRPLWTAPYANFCLMLFWVSLLH